MVYIQSEYAQEDQMHKILWEFETLTNFLIQTRKPDVVFMNNKKSNLSSKDFPVLADNRGKIKEHKDRQILRPYLRTKNNCGTKG